MYLSRRGFVLCSAALLLSPCAHAGDEATPDAAKALAEKAAAHFKEVGPDKAIADFLDPAAGYVDGDLFVVVYGPDNKVLAAYGVPVLRGKDATMLKDVDGKQFGKDILAVGKEQGTGWVEYRMTNPTTKKIALKKSWVIGMGDYVLFVGAFLH